MRIYVDTNVYLDYFLKRRNSEYAFKIFMRALACEFHIVISDQVLLELTRFTPYEECKFLFELLKKKIIFVKLKKGDREKAKLIKTHTSDAIHVLMAERSHANIS